MAKRNIVAQGAQFIKHVVPQVIRPIRSLWHEVIGFLFLSLAFLGALSGLRIVRNFDGSPESLFRLILTTCFVVIMGGYGVSSFLRARRITRS